MSAKSIVEYFGRGSGHRCGYCNGVDTNHTFGLWGHTLTVEDYQDLMDRNLRRSGKYCYKPVLNESCCPMYTIRCDAINFKLSKSQKKVLKRMTKYLASGDTKTNCATNTGDDSGSLISSQKKLQPTGSQDKSRENVTEMSTETTALPATGSDEISRPFKPSQGADPTKPQCRKAKDKRREKKLLKTAKNPTISSNRPISQEQKCEQRNLEDLLKPPSQAKHKLQVRLVQSNPPSDEFQQTFKQEFDLYNKYELTIHKRAPEIITQKKFKKFLVDSPLDPLHTENDVVNSPSTQEGHSSVGQGYGSFHQQYWLDDVLVAVGVIDILPHSVTSVYLFYDPDYSFLSLGIYTALCEISFIRNIQKVYPKIMWYYMGYYIHSCTKMKYKAQYHPSYLLCPEAYTWHPIEKCLQKLDTAIYSRFDESNTVDSRVAVKNTSVLYRKSALSFRQYHRLTNSGDETEVREYSQLVGLRFAGRALLVRSA